MLYKMKKIKITLLFLSLAYAMPLLPRPELILHPKILALMAAAAIVFLTQPGFSPNEGSRDKQADRNTVFLILGGSLLSVILPLLEWAYFSQARPLAHWALLGSLLLLGGTALRVWAIQVLGQYFTPTVLIQETHQLIQSGPFAWLRHPSYTGAYLATLGSAILLQAWWGLLFSALIMLVVYHRRIAAEEQALSERFGAAYADYQHKTYRLLPGIW
ncbi:isoprenylcysteine carboxylmethyltransferase family protein [Phaeodactylibacter luteus]|uniref:Isoprenylcysteine carboxylmethyltransferase family protein n=2 Tax=Phaeodactylibacter luteus TaxID=1564516 RepID=A0A5C6S1U0_9BACT|nr:isoprenylcysteine carboxylmethyltransferase family protein [Phaeodactylibacter luteus]